MSVEYLVNVLMFTIFIMLFSVDLLNNLYILLVKEKKNYSFTYTGIYIFTMLIYILLQRFI